MCGPKAPDPKETAAAQTGTNVGTAVANQILGNVNQITPNGNLTYKQTGMTKWTDPISGQVYELPQYTSKQTLTDIGRKTNNQTNKAGLNLASIANQQTRQIGNTLSDPLNTKGLPGQATFDGLRKTLGGAGQGITGSIGDMGDITRSYDGDYAAQRQSVEDALMARLNPSLDRDKSALEVRLASQGIGIGSEAYQAAMGDFGRQSNDARFAAILNAGEEQSRLADLSRDQATFANQAQQQAFGQGLSAADFANQAQAQGFGQRAQNAAFYNAAEQQKYNTKADARDRAMQERLTVRNQPLNEIGALMSGGQVQMPSFMNTAGGNMANTDYAGIINSGYENQMAQNKSSQQLWGGALGGIAALLSDERMKTDIREIGTSFDGQPIYLYRYTAGGPYHIGLMAQDVEKITPDAVVEIGGMKHVDYVKALEGSRA